MLPNTVTCWGCKDRPFRLVPIMLGALTPNRCAAPAISNLAPVLTAQCIAVVSFPCVRNLCFGREAAYGRLLAKYLDDPANVFIMSSDCHWGTRFNSTFRDASKVRTAIAETVVPPCQHESL